MTLVYVHDQIQSQNTIKLGEAGQVVPFYLKKKKNGMPRSERSICGFLEIPDHTY